MKTSWLRRLAILVMLVCAAAQPALGSSLVASALRFESHAEDHGHSIALRSDGNHFDVVLSHAEEDAPAPSEVPHDHEHPLGVSGDDHVVHVTASDVSSPTFRRSLGISTPALHGKISLPVPLASPRAPSQARAARAGEVDRLRTVVLRL